MQTDTDQFLRLMDALQRKTRGDSTYLFWQVDPNNRPSGLQFRVTGDDIDDTVQYFAHYVNGKPSRSKRSIYVDGQMQWMAKPIG
jgi:uncharacterized protein YhdP